MSDQDGSIEGRLPQLWQEWDEWRPVDLNNGIDEDEERLVDEDGRESESEADSE